MSFTNEQLEQFIGGQIRIVSPATDEIHQGLISRIELKNNELKVSFKWYTQNDGTAKVPLSEWTKIGYIRGRNFRLAFLLISFDELSGCGVMYSNRTKEKIRIYPKNYNGAEKIDEKTIKTTATLLERKYIWAVLEGMMREQRNIDAFCKKYRINDSEIRMILNETLQQLIFNHYYDEEEKTVGIVRSMVSKYGYSENFIIEVVYKFLDIIMFLRSSEASAIVHFLVRNFLTGPGKIFPFEPPQVPSAKLIDADCLIKAQRQYEEKINDLISAELKVSGKEIDRSPMPLAFDFRDSLRSLQLEEESMRKIKKFNPTLITGLMELLHDANSFTAD